MYWIGLVWDISYVLGNHWKTSEMFGKCSKNLEILKKISPKNCWNYSKYLRKSSEKYRIKCSKMFGESFENFRKILENLWKLLEIIEKFGEVETSGSCGVSRNTT